MTDFNQKTHDTDVGSHGGQSRQMMEVFENQEFGSIRLLQEVGKTFFCASDVEKALGYVNPYAAVKRHCRGPLTKRELPSRACSIAPIAVARCMSTAPTTASVFLNIPVPNTAKSQLESSARHSTVSMKMWYCPLSLKC